MSYAIIETGGKQLRVEPGRFYDIELLPVEPEVQVTIEKVLLVQHNGDVHIGQPLVEGATVEGTVMRHFRDRKILVYKMQPKKKTRKKRGHRQEVTRLMINSISLNGSALTSEQTTNTPVAEELAVEETPTPTASETPVIAEMPVAEESAVEETPTPTASETPVIAETPVAEELHAGSVTPDAAQENVDTVVAEEPDAETTSPQETPEDTAQ